MARYLGAEAVEAPRSPIGFFGMAIDPGQNFAGHAFPPTAVITVGLRDNHPIASLAVPDAPDSRRLPCFPKEAERGRPVIVALIFERFGFVLRPDPRFFGCTLCALQQRCDTGFEVANGLLALGLGPAQLDRSDFGFGDAVIEA